jgi:hypothetical protein
MIRREEDGLRGAVPAEIENDEAAEGWEVGNG